MSSDGWNGVLPQGNFLNSNTEFPMYEAGVGRRLVYSALVCYGLGGGSHLKKNLKQEHLIAFRYGEERIRDEILMRHAMKLRVIC